VVQGLQPRSHAPFFQGKKGFAGLKALVDFRPKGLVIYPPRGLIKNSGKDARMRGFRNKLLIS
jgi:hypothetical protein